MFEAGIGAPTAENKINERLLLYVLAAIQFTAIVDFLIDPPAGPTVHACVQHPSVQFGVIVSAYAISAGISGIASGFFLNRFDRKPALLPSLPGLCAGNLVLRAGADLSFPGPGAGRGGCLWWCGWGPNPGHHRRRRARTTCRGAAMGLVMSAFSVASICGVPIGLVLASHLNWHVPFFVLTGLSLVVLIAANRVLPSLRGHLQRGSRGSAVSETMAVLARDG